MNSFSQENKSGENLLISPSKDTIQIMPIPLPEITPNLEQAYELLKIIEGRLEPGKDLEGFDSIYDIGMKGIIDEKTRLESEDIYYSLKTIDNYLSEWKRYQESVGEWMVKINERIRTIENDLFETKKLIATWSLTYENAREGGVPDKVLTSVSDVNKKA